MPEPTLRAPSDAGAGLFALADAGVLLKKVGPMKIFERDGKLNFVDNNNVLVGFDYRANCCENFGWFLSDSMPIELPYPNPDNANEESTLDPMNFDPSFFEKVSAGCEDGGMAIFRVTDGNATKYLCLYNSHNGYYAHGFTMEVGGIMKQEGTL